MLTQSNLSRHSVPRLPTHQVSCSLYTLYVLPQHPHSCCSTWNTLHLPPRPLPSSLDHVNDGGCPSPPAFPLHCVITPLRGLNTVHLEFSCLCACHPLPDGELPVGRDGPSHSGSPACSRSGLAFSSVTEYNTNLPAPASASSRKPPPTRPLSFSITLQEGKYPHSSFVTHTGPSSETGGPLNAATMSCAHLSPLPTTCQPPLLLSPATGSQATLPFGSRKAQILVLRDLRKLPGVLYL